MIGKIATGLTEGKYIDESRHKGGRTAGQVCPRDVADPASVQTDGDSPP